jgi:predicted lactoylglutathione lyase
MPATLFVNLPVQDLERAKAFFTTLGFDLFGMAPDMASVVINENTQVMLLTRSTFAGFAANPVSDPTTTEAILVLGYETPTQVDELVDKALATGATPVGEPVTDAGRYTRSFTDPDGHQWAALCLV